ncbi:DUF3618 domain-containing protein [Microtetraspora fusca]|uniref:DUF3618 domain-containing protein n=1 Tax=Microtetraspora fusca TaxID=1997 RepID=UPI000A02ABFD|nr:DUF3618 domain-containing protein [Microtetraspora fusca]
MSETDPGPSRQGAGEVGVHSHLVECSAVDDAGDTLNETIQRVVVAWRPFADELEAAHADIERNRAELARTVAELASRFDVRSRARAKARQAGGLMLPAAVVALGAAAGLALRRARRRRLYGGGGA